MRYIIAFSLCFFLSQSAFAFTRGNATVLPDGWSVQYIFSAPDQTKGYTNIKVPLNEQNGTKTVACVTSSPCLNAVYDDQGNLTDPGSTTQPTYIQSLSDAETYSDTLAAAKEQEWIGEIGQ